MADRQPTDERRLAAAVREFATLRREAKTTQRDRDRTGLARILHTAGMLRQEIADVIGVHWSQVDRVLSGKPAKGP
jgi:DNA-binding transcriptional regulator LsrR (DeoR family)